MRGVERAADLLDDRERLARAGAALAARAAPSGRSRRRSASRGKDAVDLVRRRRSGSRSGGRATRRAATRAGSARGTPRRPPAGRDHLQRDLALEARCVGEVDGAHPAAAERPTRSCSRRTSRRRAGAARSVTARPQPIAEPALVLDQVARRRRAPASCAAPRRASRAPSRVCIGSSGPDRLHQLVVRAERGGAAARARSARPCSEQPVRLCADLDLVLLAAAARAGAAPRRVVARHVASGGSATGAARVACESARRVEGELEEAPLAALRRPRGRRRRRRRGAPSGRRRARGPVPAEEGAVDAAAVHDEPARPSRSNVQWPARETSSSGSGWSAMSFSSGKRPTLARARTGRPWSPRPRSAPRRRPPPSALEDSIDRLSRVHGSAAGRRQYSFAGQGYNAKRRTPCPAPSHSPLSAAALLAALTTAAAAQRQAPLLSAPPRRGGRTADAVRSHQLPDPTSARATSCASIRLRSSPATRPSVRSARTPVRARSRTTTTSSTRRTGSSPTSSRPGRPSRCSRTGRTRPRSRWPRSRVACGAGRRRASPSGS